ncbi:hypothetical protein M413DRAFT_82832 [Hebeloma cylindrosporum]|uniref:Uncharacterized protein n=1 Tax=Hebeloma cylindrosporum TaxID=76867 RepID=A0A0C3CJ00_HEBCY|nr:hypothetical protein M413DRAFT_82832 [Hebeloma cylindrosporum h7]
MTYANWAAQFTICAGLCTSSESTLAGRAMVSRNPIPTASILDLEDIPLCLHCHCSVVLHCLPILPVLRALKHRNLSFGPYLPQTRPRWRVRRCFSHDIQRKLIATYPLSLIMDRVVRT